MKRSKVFNPQGNDLKEQKSLWHGNPTNLINLNQIKYNWATVLYQQMRSNFWIPQKIDLTEDVNDYLELTSSERKIFKGVLSYLTFLDSIQTVNLPHLRNPITASEVSLCIAEQISQEAMHNQSYQYIIETIIPESERNPIYEYWRENKILFERCKGITELYENYTNNPTEENYLIALFADYLLEGIYFYNGFNIFYNFAFRGLLGSTSDIFKIINRDELSHVRLFQELITEGLKVFPHSKEQLLEITDKAVKREIEWTEYIIDSSIPELSQTEQYTKYQANLRLKAVGLPELYPEVKQNPYKHLETFKNSSAGVKSNFFESNVTDYQMTTAVGSWDF